MGGDPLLGLFAVLLNSTGEITYYGDAYVGGNPTYTAYPDYNTRFVAGNFLNVQVFDWCICAVAFTGVPRVALHSSVSADPQYLAIQNWMESQDNVQFIYSIGTCVVLLLKDKRTIAMSMVAGTNTKITTEINLWSSVQKLYPTPVGFISECLDEDNNIIWKYASQITPTNATNHHASFVEIMDNTAIWNKDNLSSIMHHTGAGFYMLDRDLGQFQYTAGAYGALDYDTIQSDINFQLNLSDDWLGVQVAFDSIVDVSWPYNTPIEQDIKYINEAGKQVYIYTRDGTRTERVSFKPYRYIDLPVDGTVYDHFDVMDRRNISYIGNGGLISSYEGGGYIRPYNVYNAGNELLLGNAGVAHIAQSGKIMPPFNVNNNRLEWDDEFPATQGDEAAQLLFKHTCYFRESTSGDFAFAWGFLENGLPGNFGCYPVAERDAWFTSLNIPLSVVDEWTNLRCVDLCIRKNRWYDNAGACIMVMDDGTVRYYGDHYAEVTNEISTWHNVQRACFLFKWFTGLFIFAVTKDRTHYFGIFGVNPSFIPLEVKNPTTYEEIAQKVSLVPHYITSVCSYNAKRKDRLQLYLGRDRVLLYHNQTTNRLRAIYLNQENKLTFLGSGSVAWDYASESCFSGKFFQIDALHDVVSGVLTSGHLQSHISPDHFWFNKAKAKTSAWDNLIKVQISASYWSPFPLPNGEWRFTGSYFLGLKANSQILTATGAGEQPRANLESCLNSDWRGSESHAPSLHGYCAIGDVTIKDDAYILVDPRQEFVTDSDVILRTDNIIDAVKTSDGIYILNTDNEVIAPGGAVMATGVVGLAGNRNGLTLESPLIVWIYADGTLGGIKPAALSTSDWGALTGVSDCLTDMRCPVDITSGTNTQPCVGSECFEKESCLTYGALNEDAGEIWGPYREGSPAPDRDTYKVQMSKYENREQEFYVCMQPGGGVQEEYIFSDLFTGSIIWDTMGQRHLISPEFRTEDGGPVMSYRYDAHMISWTLPIATSIHYVNPYSIVLGVNAQGQIMVDDWWDVTGDAALPIPWYGSSVNPHYASKSLASYFNFWENIRTIANFAEVHFDSGVSLLGIDHDKNLWFQTTSPTFNVSWCHWSGRTSFSDIANLHTRWSVIEKTDKTYYRLNLTTGLVPVVDGMALHAPPSTKLAIDINRNVWYYHNWMLGWVKYDLPAGYVADRVISTYLLTTEDGSVFQIKSVGVVTLLWDAAAQGKGIVDLSLSSFGDLHGYFTDHTLFRTPDADLSVIRERPNLGNIVIGIHDEDWLSHNINNVNEPFERTWSCSLFMYKVVPDTLESSIRQIYADYFVEWDNNLPTTPWTIKWATGY